MALKHLSARVMRHWVMCSFTMQVIAWNQGAAIMKPQEKDAGPSDLDDSTLLVPVHPLAIINGFVNKTLAIAEFEVRKLRHDYTELVTRAIQPVLWFVLFGEVFTKARTIPTGDIPYRDFLAPGVLAQSVLFVAILYGIAIIWERDSCTGEGAIGWSSLTITSCNHLRACASARSKGELEAARADWRTGCSNA
jgi:hypothetical protein